MSDPVPVVVESPYSGHVALNVHYALHCMRHSLERGEAPVLTHLLYTRVPTGDHVPDGAANRVIDRELGLVCARQLRKACGIMVLYLDEGFSPGMKRAEKEALHDDVTIHYRYLPGWTATKAKWIAEAPEWDPARRAWLTSQRVS